MVESKDADFASSFLLRRSPRKLLLISTGNISNAALEALLMSNLPRIVAVLEANDVLELNRQGLIVHE